MLNTFYLIYTHTHTLNSMINHIKIDFIQLTLTTIPFIHIFIIYLLIKNTVKYVKIKKI